MLFRSFFTNYKSKKGHDIDNNNKACLNFFWSELSRQVRIAGKLKKLSAKESEEYFHSRPRESQLGAWASSQSDKISNREALEKQFASYEKQFEGKKGSATAALGRIHPDSRKNRVLARTSQPPA